MFNISAKFDENGISNYIDTESVIGQYKLAEFFEGKDIVDKVFDFGYVDDMLFNVICDDRESEFGIKDNT